GVQKCLGREGGRRLRGPGAKACGGRGGGGGVLIGGNQTLIRQKLRRTQGTADTFSGETINLPFLLKDRSLPAMAAMFTSVVTMVPFLFKHLTATSFRMPWLALVSPFTTAIKTPWSALTSASSQPISSRGLSALSSVASSRLLERCPGRPAPSGSSAQRGATLLGRCQQLVCFQPSAGMKTKTALKRRCKDCFIVRRRGALFVVCKTHPRHKQRQG
ncbi:hypothetical protein CRUP_035160, partial [Coryphaenoides rupestris]